MNGLLRTVLAVGAIGVPAPEHGAPAARPDRASIDVADAPNAGVRVRDLNLIPTSGGDFWFRDPGGRFSALISSDGTVRFADRGRRSSRRNSQHGKGTAPLPARAANPFTGIRFGGLLEWLMRWSHQDPAGAAKADFLALTAEFRQRLARGALRVRIEAEVSSLPHRLHQLWANEALTQRERRRRIFRLWDDWAQGAEQRHAGGSAPGNDELEVRSQGAARGQHIVEEFVRRHLPQGGPRSYSPTELAELNRGRHATTLFSPYVERSAL